MNDRRSEPGRSPNYIQIAESWTGTNRYVGWRWPRPEGREPIDLTSVLWGYGVALLVSLGVTLAAMPLLPYLDQANIVMLFLLAVVSLLILIIVA